MLNTKIWTVTVLLQYRLDLPLAKFSYGEQLIGHD